MREKKQTRDELLKELETMQDRMVELEIREIERREMDRNLLENHWTLSSLVNGLIGIAYRRRIDRSWTMEYVSDGCRALTGFDPDDIVGNRRYPIVSFGQFGK